MASKTSKRPKRGKRGPPRFVPTPHEREQVKTLAGYGIAQDQIARLLARPIAKSTLMRAFRDELDAGIAMANAKVAESLYVQAVGAPAQYDQNGRLLRAEQPRVPSCGMFWAKARMGWRDVTRLEGPGPKGEIVHKHESDLKHLSDEQLEQLEEIHRRLEAGRAAEPRSDSGGEDATKH